MFLASTNATGYQTSEDVSWVRGAHQIGWGVNYIHSILNSNAYTSSAANFAFTAANTGLGLGDFMLGKPNTYQQASVGQFNFRANYIGMYLQDTWKVSPRLTVNVGLRWDPYLPQYAANGQTFHFDQQWFLQGIHSTVYPNAPCGCPLYGRPWSSRQWEKSAERVVAFLTAPGVGLGSQRAIAG